LRKTGAVDAVMAGAGVAGLKSFGWKSDSQALYYARGVDKRQQNEQTIDLWNAAIERQGRRSQIRRVK
jgi:hypothetical protein